VDASFHCCLLLSLFQSQSNQSDRSRGPPLGGRQLPKEPLLVGMQATSQLRLNSEVCAEFICSLHSMPCSDHDQFGGGGCFAYFQRQRIFSTTPCPSSSCLDSIHKTMRLAGLCPLLSPLGCNLIACSELSNYRTCGYGIHVCTVLYMYCTVGSCYGT
jgi:hypothetical protein